MVADLVANAKRRARRNGLVWRYVLNLKPTLAYRLGGQAPSGAAADVLAQLRRDGVARTTVRDLFPNASLLDELLESVKQIETVKAGEISAARRSATSEEVGKKTFMVELLGKKPVLEPDSVFARLALAEPLLTIANAYYGMFTKLRYYNVWRTFATEGKARESQLWHRDREDRLILKAFLYCVDVDEGGGPFTYAPGTHPLGSVRREPPGFAEPDGTLRSTDDQMAQLVPADRWVRCTGKKGTIVLADTRGYHKGGECRTADRVMYTCMYTSAASQSANLLERPHSSPALSRTDAAYAVGH